jgi:hypothetical protein
MSNKILEDEIYEVEVTYKGNIRLVFAYRMDGTWYTQGSNTPIEGKVKLLKEKKPETQRRVFKDYTSTGYVQLTRITPDVAYQLAKMGGNWQCITYEQLNAAVENSKREVLFPWHADDVMQQAKTDGVTVSEAEAAYLLQQIRKNHNAEVGCNWDVISMYLSEFNDARKATRKAKKAKRDADKGKA